MDGVPPRRFHLSLLGRFKLTGPGGVIDLPSKKLAGLLTYLACTSRQPQRREILSALLWGSHFDLQAKQNLRQALFRLRKLLGQDALEGDGEVVSLNPASVLSDVGRFEALVREGSRDALAAAAELYQGPLVDDVVVSEEGWSGWLTTERERLLELALGALLRLGEQELSAGRAEHALKAGQRAVALNSMREDAHRLIVRALAAQGRKADALKHYEDLIALLKRELNAEPDAATVSLAAELRRAPPPAVDKIVEPRLDADQAAKRAPKTEKAAAPIDAAPSAVPTRSADPERRQLTIMVCNMVSSMPLSARLDPEEMHDLIVAFHKVVGDVVARFDGFVAQHLGDRVFVYFGYPAAHEHDAEQAVRAGRAVIDAVAAQKASSDALLQARVGIATGLVVVGEQLAAGDSLIAIGEAPSLAAQLQAVAGPGEVVIAGSTRRLVGRMFDCLALGGDEIQGLPQPAQAWQVRGEAADVSRFEARRSGALTPLVGREEEMELLLRRWGQAKLGEGRVVVLSGEPGIGKSRIAEGLLARLESEPHVRLRYFCSPHHTHSSLHPFIAQLERAAKFDVGSGASKNLDKLEALLKPTARNAARDLALIADLLSVPTEGRYPALAVSPRQKREMTLTALVDQLDGVAARKPVLILFEDAQWIDPTSLDLLDRTVARIADRPVLLVVTVRPELQPTWVGQPHVTILALSRLGRRDSARIVAGVTRDKPLPDAVVEQVIAHTDGVPLFIEELTSTLLESGMLRETSDRYVLDGPLPPLAIPTTLQDSLVARLDRLASPKDVAQIGAAIGREFSHELIAAVSALAPMDLDAALGRLTASGLISRRGTPPNATYSFQHALVQDAAYATMLRSRRRQLHASIAKVLVEQFSAVTESQPELVAHHFIEAGLASEASGYWRRAGQLAAARSANREAVNFFERALQAVEALPDSRERAIDLHLEAGRCLLILGELGRKRDHARQAEALAESLGDERLLARTILALAAGAWTGGDLDHALELGERGRAIARRVNDVALQTLGTYVLGLTGQTAGNYRQSAEAFRQVSETLRGDRRHEVVLPGAGLGSINAQTRLVWCLAELGEFAEAMARSEEALQIAGEVEHSSSLVLSYRSLGIVFLRLGVIPQAIQAFERAVELCRAAEVRVLFDITAVHLGYACALSGRVAEGTTLMEEALAEPEATGITHRPLLLAYLGEARLLAGRRDDATAVAGRALDLARAQKERGNEGWVLRLLGDIAAQADPTDPKPAAQYYAEALVRANELGMRPLAAHCHAGLAKLTRRVGKPQDANEHFATATAMYRDMGMTSWLEKLEGELRPE